MGSAWLLALLTAVSSPGQVKVWRLLDSGQDLSSSPHVTLGPEGSQVDVLLFHPTADGVLASGAQRAVKIWDVEQQQPLAGEAAGGGGEVGRWPPSVRGDSLVAGIFWNWAVETSSVQQERLLQSCRSCSQVQAGKSLGRAGRQADVHSGWQRPVNGRGRMPRGGAGWLGRRGS